MSAHHTASALAALLALVLCGCAPVKPVKRSKIVESTIGGISHVELTPTITGRKLQVHAIGNKRCKRFEKISYVNPETGKTVRRTTNRLATHDCEHGPAVDVQVRLQLSDADPIYFKTDEEGVVTISLLVEDWSRFQYLGPGVTFDCVEVENCDEVSVDLPPDFTAEVVLARGRLDEVDRWLQDYSGRPSKAVAEVQAARKELVARREDAAAKHRKRARKSLDDGDAWTGAAAAKSCLDLVPDHPECRQMLQDARTVLTNMHGKLRIKDMALLREPSGFQAYFSIVDEKGRYLWPAGQVRWGVLAYNQPTTMLWEDVRPDDFKQVTLGMAAFQRPAVVHSRYFSSSEYEERLSGFVRAAPARDKIGFRFFVEFIDPFGRSVMGDVDFIE